MRVGQNANQELGYDMERKRQVLLAALLALVCVSASAQGAVPDQGMRLKSRIENAIGIARAGGSDGAHELANLTGTSEAAQIHDESIAHIASLLASPDDMIRLWVAKALGESWTAGKNACTKASAMNV